MKSLKFMLTLTAAGSLAAAAMGAEAAKAAAQAEAKTAPQAAAPAAAKVAPAPKAEAPAVDVWAGIPDVLAVVDGKEITKAEVRQMLEAQLPDGKMPPAITAEILKSSILPGIVNQIIQGKILDAALSKNGIVPSEALALAELKKQIDTLPAAEKKQIEEQMKARQTTIEKELAAAAKNPEMQKRVAMFALMNKVSANVPEVTEAEAKKYYDANPKYFQHPVSYTAAHILFAPAGKEQAQLKEAFDKANAAYEKLKKDPKQFEAIAKAESACPSKARGGQLGTFEKGQMVPEFEAALDKMKPGEISAPVKTQFGYHLIRLDKMTPATIDSFDSVKKDLMQMMTMKNKSDVFQQYLMKLQKELKVENKLVPAPAPAPALAPVAK